MRDSKQAVREVDLDLGRYGESSFSTWRCDEPQCQEASLCWLSMFTVEGDAAMQPKCLVRALFIAVLFFCALAEAQQQNWVGYVTDPLWNKLPGDKEHDPGFEVHSTMC